MPDPFISTKDVVDYLGRGGTADPGMLIAVDAACDICRDVAEQTFNRSTSTVTLDGSGTDALVLPEGPVTGAGTVLVNGGTVTNYVLNDNGVLIRKITSPVSVDWWTTQYYPALVWPAGRQNVQVTFDHGYADADIPRSVRMVALSVAARLVVQGPATEESVGPVRVKYAAAATDLTNGELRILRKYRRSA